MKQFEHQDPSKPWTRIKLAELSFNALRVALVDPTARVRACASVPRSIPRIRGVAITGGFLHEETIHFSDNLNCLIGGRGTGKSTAIRAIAYAFGLNDEFGDYDNCPDSVTVLLRGRKRHPVPLCSHARRRHRGKGQRGWIGHGCTDRRVPHRVFRAR